MIILFYFTLKDGRSHTFFVQVLCWRTVPTSNAGIGEVARNSEPFMRQVFLVSDGLDEDTLKRQVSKNDLY